MRPEKAWHVSDVIHITCHSYAGKCNMQTIFNLNLSSKFVVFVVVGEQCTEEISVTGV